MILLRSFLSGHIRIKRTLEYYDAGIGPRVPFGGGFGPTVSANFAVALGDFTTLSSTSTMPTGGSISRAGNAMLYDSTGKLTYAPNNLVLYSQDFSQSNWDKTAYPVTITGGQSDPFNGTSATQLKPTTANDFHLAFQGVSVVSSTKYIISGYFKANGYSQIRFGNGSDSQGVDVDLSAVTATAWGTGSSPTITPVAGAAGWYRVSAVFTQATTASKNMSIYIKNNSGSLSYAGDGTSAILAYGIQLEAVTYQTTPSTYVATTTSAYYGPRFDYDPVTLAAKGLLVEGTRTNLYFPSTNVNGFTSVFRTAFGVPTANAAVAPDGSSTADQIMETATTNNFVLQLAKSQPTGQYTFSIHVKGINKSWVRIAFYDSSVAGGAFFNIPSNGSGFSVGTQSNATGAMSYVGNGWYRLSITFQNTLGTPIYCQIYGAVSNGNDYYAGNTSNGYYIWGWQLEQAPFASSYIPTVANATARAAETFSLTGYANRLVEAFYIDEQTGANYSGNSALSTGTVTISPPTFGWVTSLRAYQNAYAGSISTPSWLSFSGTTGTTAGNRTYYDSTGTLTWAPANLVKYSQDFSKNASGEWVDYWAGPSSRTANTTAVTDPLGGNTATRLVLPSYTSNLTPGVVQYNLNTTGRKVISSVWARGASGGEIIAVSGDDINFTSYTLTTSWQRISSVVSSGASQMSIVSYLGASGASQTIYLWGAQSELATYATAPSAYIPTTSAAVYGPRYDFDPSTVPATPRGLLIEEQRVNLLLQSQTINTTWSVVNLRAFGSGSVVDAAVAPDGTTTADLIVEDTTNNQHYIAQNPTNNNAIDTFSVYVKAAGRTNVRLVGFGTVPNNFTVLPSAYFNLATGAVTSSSQCTASIASVGNGWYRCVISANAAIPNTSATMQWNVYLVSTGTTDSYTGDGVSGVYVWGAQVEAGSFATSYIPSITGATRAPDVAQLTGSALTVGQGSAGTAIVQFSTPTLTGTEYALSYDNSGTSIYANTTFVRSIGAGVNSGGSGQANLTFSPAISANTVSRAAFAWTTNSFAAVANNGTVQPDPSGILPVGINVGYLGLYRASPLSLNGPIASVALYNQRLPDAILKQKSTVGAPY